MLLSGPNPQIVEPDENEKLAILRDFCKPPCLCEFANYPVSNKAYPKYPSASHNDPRVPEFVALTTRQNVPYHPPGNDPTPVRTSNDALFVLLPHTGFLLFLPPTALPGIYLRKALQLRLRRLPEQSTTPLCSLGKLEKYSTMRGY